MHNRSNPDSGVTRSRYPGSFLLAFREAAAAIGWQLRAWKGDMVECIQANGQEQLVGLENLYRRAKQTPRENWPGLIADFLRTVSAAVEDETLPADLAQAGERLLVRVGPPMRVPGEDAKVWSSPLANTGLSVNLVIDYPNRMCYVTEKLVEASGQAGAEWLGQASRNLLARTPADCFQSIHEESGLLLCALADAYDSSRAVLLDALLPAHRELGYFVALPGRDELLVLPVAPASLPFVHLLKMLAEKNFKTAPYPISDEVYWVRGGHWQRFPITFKGNEVIVEPPPEFIEQVKKMQS